MRNPSCLISCSQPGPEGGALAGDRKQGSIIPSSGPVRSRKVAVNRSVELIVQPGAKDAVGEMGVRGNLPAGHGNTNRCRGTRSDACGVERAKVHVKALYFPGPVTWNRNQVAWQVPLRAPAHHPTGINLRMTDGLGKRECIAPQILADCAR